MKRKITFFFTCGLLLTIGALFSKRNYTLGVSASKSPDSRASSGSSPNSANKREPANRPRLEDVLAAHSVPGSQWKIQSLNGSPVRLTDGKIKSMLADRAKEVEFVNALGLSLGLGEGVRFRRGERGTGRFTVVDHNQDYAFPNGAMIPVFGAYLRLFVNGRGEIFMMQNETRPVDPQIDLSSSLTATEAMQITAAHVHDRVATISVYKPEVVLFADSSPHQLASQVLSTKAGSSRLFLIGHTTRSVLRDIELTRQ